MACTDAQSSELIDPAVSDSLQVESRRDAVAKRMAMPGYTSKTPESVRAEDADKLGKLEAELAAVLSHTADMQQMLKAQQ